MHEKILKTIDTLAKEQNVSKDVFQWRPLFSWLKFIEYSYHWKKYKYFSTDWKLVRIYRLRRNK